MGEGDPGGQYQGGVSRNFSSGSRRTVHGTRAPRRCTTRRPACARRGRASSFPRWCRPEPGLWFLHRSRRPRDLLRSMARQQQALRRARPIAMLAAWKARDEVRVAGMGIVVPLVTAGPWPKNQPVVSRDKRIRPSLLSGCDDGAPDIIQSTGIPRGRDGPGPLVKSQT
jgi:hypothetical protein